MDEPLSLTFKALLPAAKAVFGTVAHLHAQRSAAANPWRADRDQLTNALRRSLDRLRVDQLDQGWWEGIWNAVGQEIVSSEVLRKPTVQSWLRKDGVEQGLLDLAAAGVMQTALPTEQDTKDRLSNAYSEATGDGQHLAEDAIDTVVAILVAGYIATIPKPQRPVAGMIRQVSQQIDQRMDGIERKIDAARVRDPVAERVHTQEADNALAVLLKRRLFGIEQPEQEFRALHDRVADGGDWAAASDASRLRIQYWAARVCAGSPETLEYARRLRTGLKADDPDGLLVVVDAKIAATGGAVDEAIRSLREVDHADARTTVLRLLVGHRGEKDGLAAFASVDPATDPKYFTDVGWKVWAVSLAILGRWEDAIQGLRSLAGAADWSAALAMVEGTVNAAMLTKKEARAGVLDGPLVYLGIGPRLGEEARQHHRRAVECFEHFGEAVAQHADERLASFLDLWRTWLGLMDPDSGHRASAQEQLRSRMANGADAVHLMFLALGFRVEFDPTALSEHLAHRDRFGGLDDEQVRAECLLGRVTLNPRDFAAYVERRKARLERVMGVAETTSLLFEALEQDKQFDRAREVASSATCLPSPERARMLAALDAESGKDMLGELQAAYADTGSHVDLMNVIGYLQTSGNHEAARPYVRALFDDDPTVDNALAVVDSLSRPEPDHGAIAGFFAEHGDLAGQRRDLKVAHAFALFHTGALREARGLIDTLLDDSARQDALALDVNVTIASGDWDRLPLILQRELRWRDDLGVEALMRLAQIAADSRQSVGHALALARLATEKAPDDPRVLAWAYAFHFQLGRDDEADPAWLSLGEERSSAHEGPIWVKDLSQLVHEVLPRQRERRLSVQERLMAGQLPMVLAASALNTPLSRILLEAPRIASENQDARRRAILPIVSGSHEPVEIRDGWTVALDLTSVLLLSHIGLLEDILDAPLDVRVPQEVMEWLFAERFAARFHQPTQVESARRLRRLIDRRRVRVVESPAQPPPSVAEEVGIETAELLETSRRETGVTVCARPIHKAQSLMEDIADTSAYDDIIYTPADLCAAARARGVVESDAHNRAVAFLEMQGQSAAAELTSEALDGPIFVDQLALSYLQGADVLDALSALDLRIHANVAGEATAFIEAGELGVALVTELEQIRACLRRGVESGKLTFLPRATAAADESLPTEPAQRALQALFAAAEVCDAVCVDDRFINARGQVTAPSGRSAPVFCVMDVLQYFRRKEAITAARHWQALHRLRRGGFAWTPVEAEELSDRLREAVTKDGTVTESAELRTLRQSLNHLDSEDFLTPQEAPAAVGKLVLACLRAIRDLWEDSEVPVDDANARCDWIWRHLLATTLLSAAPPDADHAGNSPQQPIATRFALLLTPIIADSSTRRSAYADWVAQRVLASLQPANADLVQEALSTSVAIAQGHDRHRAAIGRLYFDSVPEPLRSDAIAMDPAFALECGVEAGDVITLGDGAGIPLPQLLTAALAVYRGQRTASLVDLSGRELQLSLRGGNGKPILSVEWQDAEGTGTCTDVPELGLVSPEASTRTEVLRGIMNWLGPTANIPVDLAEAATSRELTFEEVSQVLAETSGGVASFRDRFLRRFTGRAGLAVADFVPQTAEYWTRLCGPLPNRLTDPDAYIRHRLVPHRRELLARDLRGGLDICCAGALRDDLLPGPWLHEVDDDTLWDALDGMDTRGNAIAVLAALDLALYRAADPRFRDFAADAVQTLSDADLGLPADREAHRLFHLACGLVWNALPMVAGMSALPGYWRRMCAWMQAGTIVQMLAADGGPANADSFADWCASNGTFAGEARRMMDCRTEPLVLASQAGPQSLRYEIVVRTMRLRARHEAAGRDVPMSEGIGAGLDRLAAAETPVQPVPGPCELHIAPHPSMPEAELPADIRTGEDDPKVLGFYAGMSQLYELGPADVQRCAQATRHICADGNIHVNEILEQAYAASIVAAASRSASLADAVGDCVTS